MTAGRGKPAMYAPGHRNDVTNKELRAQGYFKKRYKDKVKQAIEAAQRYWKRGLRGQALITQLHKEGFQIGKTLLARNRLWDEGD